MLKIAICDDDLGFTGSLETMVLEESRSIGIRADTNVFSDGKTLLKSIQSGERYGLIFIDIEMEQVDGISAARKIRETDRSVLFIYISGYDKYLKELFEVEPFRFLSKPLDKEKFRRYFKEACQRIGETEIFFQFTYNREIRKVPLKDIVYFESRNRVVHIFLRNGSTAYFYGKLSVVEKELADSRRYFLRIHQSFLVNYDYITKMNFFNITISMNGKEMELKISEDRQKEVRRQLIQWQRERLSLNEGISFNYIGISASGTATSDYTEIHNNPFRFGKQETHRHDRLAFILCLPCYGRVWYPVSSAVSVGREYPDGIYDQYRYQKRESEKTLYQHPSYLYGMDAGRSHCAAGLRGSWHRQMRH